MRLTTNAYGKERIRMVRVRRGERHRVDDLTVGVRFSGAYEDAYRGDNRAVLPTDTMKNTVYALARREPWKEPEELALLLARHFLAGGPPLREVEVEIEARLWPAVGIGGEAHPHAFAAPREERRTARASGGPDGLALESGIEGLALLKTTGSAFTDFRRDELTTLPEREDRLLATTLSATWRHREAAGAAGASWDDVRDLLVTTFAGHASRSVQHTLLAIGEAVLAAQAGIAEIWIGMPNQHHDLVDLGRLGLDNPEAIYLAYDEPFGMIEGTVSRE